MPAPEQAFAAMALVEGLAMGAPVGFALLDDAGEIALVSASMPAGLHAEIASGAREVIATGRARPGVELRADGGRRLVVSLHPLEHEGRRMVGAIAVDITARAETEDALRASEHALATAQRMARMGWWILWFESRAADISPELVDLLGLDPALLGREATEAWLAAVVDEDRASLLEAGRRSALTGVPLDVRYRVRHPDGALRAVHARGDVVRSAEGKVVALQGFAQDVSDWAAAAARQRAVAELGRDALRDLPVEELMDRGGATRGGTT
jgi:PAS domain-containing protein